MNTEHNENYYALYLSIMKKVGVKKALLMMGIYECPRKEQDINGEEEE